MVWIIFLIIACLTALILTPIKKWKRLWPAGITGLILLYLIDSTFVRLEAYSYTFSNSLPSGIPTFFWLSSFPGGMILAYYYPQRKRWQFPYILVAAAIFLVMELVMYWLSYFHYNKWNPVNSYFLNVIGFTVVLHLSEWFGAVGRK